MNIAENLERARLFFPDKAALIFENQTLTYRQLDENANRLANGLQALGLVAGDRAALFLPNIPEFVIGYFAIQKLGAIAVSINSMLKRDEVKYIVDDAGAKLLFTTVAQREHVPADELPTLRHVVIAEGQAGNDLALQDLVAAGTRRFACAETGGQDPAAILYTSGTTGFPKGAVLTQANIVSNSTSAANHSGMAPGDRLHLFLPLFHCFGQNYILNGGIRKCATIVLHRRFEPEPVADAISRRQVTMFFAVPTIYTYLINMDTSGYDFSSLRYCFTAAANMPTETSQQWKEKSGLTIFEGYGLTECSPFASYNHEFRHKPGSIGMPIENVEMKIVDKEGHALPPGEMGEIVIRGPNVMQRYWKNPPATADAIRDGWLRSGDIGTTDEEGYFYIADRVKDMINAAGFNVYPNEVEQVIYKHPAVQEAAVYGMPDPTRGETVYAAVVLKGGATATSGDLIEFCRTHMAVYKVPRKLEFVAQLPKSATGKILKRVLRGDK